MSAINVYMKAEDKDDLIVQLFDANRVPLVLLPGTTGVFRMRNQATGTVVVNNGTVVVDAANGTLTYSWQGTETNTPGTYEGVFVLTPPSGKKQSVPKYGFIIITIDRSF